MAACVTGDVVYIGDIAQVSSFFSKGIDGILSDIGAAIMSAAVDLFSGLADVPTLSTTDGVAINGEIRMQINWLVVTIAVCSLLVAAFRMAFERRGSFGIEALKGLVRMIFASTAAWIVVSWLAAEADTYSNHLYDQGIKAQLQLISKCGTDGLTAFLLIIIGLLLLIAGVVHIILMYIRLGAMTLLVGMLPMAAAASMTETGTGWWRKHLAWMVAWLAYKPTVGLIMYGGAVMIGATGSDAKQLKLAGAGILLLAGVALPALMRLVVPAMSAMGGSDGSAAGAGGAAAGTAAMASGAKKYGISGPKPAGSSSGGSSGSGGARGAAGSGRPQTKTARTGRAAVAVARGTTRVGLGAAKRAAGGLSAAHNQARGVTGGAIPDE